jgi:hypothetical protein
MRNGIDKRISSALIAKNRSTDPWAKNYWTGVIRQLMSIARMDNTSYTHKTHVDNYDSFLKRR